MTLWKLICALFRRQQQTTCFLFISTCDDETLVTRFFFVGKLCELSFFCAELSFLESFYEVQFEALLVRRIAENYESFCCGPNGPLLVRRKCY